MPSLTCKRIFLIVLDSFGIGELPDAAAYGDAGSNTLASISHSPAFRADTLQRLGLFNIEGVDCREGVNAPLAAYGRCVERSKGKDTTTGHWEIAGLVSDHPLPTYPDGFPAEVLDAFTQATGRGVLCNRPYSGTQVILDYGRAHLETGKLIVYTSADSVFQIAAHESQLGYTVRLLPNGLTTEFDEKKESDKDKDAGKKEEAKSSDKKEKKNPSEEERDQEIWLKDNAYKFGFIIRYPKQKEDATGKRYQPYTLRYVGKEIAKKLHDEGYVLDEVNISDLKE